MSPPRRRSSRLRGSNATPGKQSVNYYSNHLASLTERDETPIYRAQSNLDSIVSSPLPPRTPATACLAKPSQEEMHPSKAHQSTTKQPDSGLRLGFTDIGMRSADQPSGIAQRTPSKTGISSPCSDFKFARPSHELGPEARRMMDELREETLQIKAKLAAEQEEEKRRRGAEICSGGIGGRKIAQPKGKVGRFSDVHMAEFRKMDSIAGHPSAFRAQPDRFASATTQGLKRSQSRAKLDDRDALQDSQSAKKSNQPDRLENTAPAKRARQNIMDDTSSARPVSRHNETPETVPSTPTIARSQSNLLASITTPTQASLARSAILKCPATQIPTLVKSPSKFSLGDAPRGVAKSNTVNTLSSLPRSQSKNFLRSPGALDRVKSILRYPSSNKKAHGLPSAIASFARSPKKPTVENVLPPVPATPGFERVKHVNFAPDTVSKRAFQTSPSPVKSGIPRSTSKISFGVKSSAYNHPNGVGLQPQEVNYPSIAGHPSVSKHAGEIKYPSLAEVRPLPEPPRQTKSEPRYPPSVPSNFTFRSDHTISFGASPKGFGSSPGQSSIRPVRESILPNTMPGSFPVSNRSNKENRKPLPMAPHGMSNKKRRRVDSDDEEEEQVERSPKKQKSNIAEHEMAAKLQAEKTAPKSKIPSPSKKKGVLTLSRLNMLARPKMRK